jgi:c(7)-type cytochrome triheme protein
VKRVLRAVLALAFLSVAVLLNTMSAQPAKAPAKMVFESKFGKVTFDHEGHAKREKGDCKVCHDKLFPQSKAPLNFKAAMHKKAEADKVSCAGCHHPGGKAFESKANCNKCHVKGG